MRSMKLFNIVKYLKSTDFYHDTFDLEDEGVMGVLEDYGICDEFPEEEVEELRKDLYELAEKNEFREAMFLTSNTEIDGLQTTEEGF